MKYLLSLLVVLGLMSTALLHAGESDLEAQLKALQEKKKTKVLELLDAKKDAIITAEIVVKVSATYRGQKQPPKEQKMRIPGTMIRKDGLTLVSNSFLDPSAAMAGRMQVSLDVEILSSKLVLNDGTELPAKIVLKDKDLDLAFVLPEEPGTDYCHIPLNPEIKPAMLDGVMTIQRMGLSANRTPLLQSGKINGIIEKPRVHYVGPQATPGHPALDKDGACFGFFLRGIGIDAKRPVILPASDILEAVGQIKDTKEEKEEKE